jgi:lysozyme family protein
MPAGCDYLPPALAFFHFDTAVNHGVTGAIRLLQQAVSTDVDAEMGPLTLAAVARGPIVDLLRAYAEVRPCPLRALPPFLALGTRLARPRRYHAFARTRDRRRAAICDRCSFQASSRTAERTTRHDRCNTSASTDGLQMVGQSMTIWGAIITTLSTVLPVMGPALGVDITADLVREVGAEVVQTVQAIGGIVGTILTIYGRARGSQPLAQRAMSLKN